MEEQGPRELDLPKRTELSLPLIQPSNQREGTEQSLWPWYGGGGWVNVGEPGLRNFQVGAQGAIRNAAGPQTEVGISWDFMGFPAVSEL